MVDASISLGCFDELIAKILPIKSVVIKRLLARKYYMRLRDAQSAQRLIAEVIKSDAAAGKDYVLFGNVSDTDQTAMEAYERGYQLFDDLECLYNLLSLQYSHNNIDKGYLEVASKVNNDAMQYLVSFCFGRIGLHREEKEHAIRALLLCDCYKKEIYGHCLKLELEQSGRETVDYVSEDTYVALRDSEGNIKRFCFYGSSDVLPYNGILFANANHFAADLSGNVFYSQLYRHESGDVVALENSTYTIIELGDVGGFLLRECLSKLASNGDVVQFTGEINQTIDELTKYLIDSHANSERLLNEYKDLSRAPVYSYMFLSKHFSCSYISLLYKLSCSGPMLRSMHNDETLASKEYVVGLDTIFLLSRLELSKKSYERICSRLIMSETAYKHYQQGKEEDYKQHDRSVGFMSVIDNQPVMTQVDPRELNRELNELYKPIDQIVQSITRKDAIFTCPSEYSELKDKVTELIGQEVADGLQLSTLENVLVINDAFVAYMFATLYSGSRWGTIMNLLAHVDLTLHEMITCLRSLSKNRFVSVFVLDFFDVLIRKFDDIKEREELDAYEAELAYFIEVFSDLISDKAEHGHFLCLMKILIEKYPMSDVLIHMIAKWAMLSDNFTKE